MTTHTPSRRWYTGVAGTYIGLAIALLAMVLFFGSMSEYFLSANTFITIANDIPALTVLAVGMTYVLIIAGIDLSVGSVMALSSALCSLAMLRWGWGLAPALLLGLVSGAACGFLTGFVSVQWQLPSFIVSLGMLEIARGAAYVVTDSRTQYIGSDVDWLSSNLIGGISPAFVIALAVIVIGQLVLTRSVFGRYMIGIGTNEEAMRLAGVDPRPIKVAVFTLIGLLASVAGLMQTSRLEAADPNTGIGMELQVIAAVVIGGTSLMGGRGSVISTFFGVLIIAVLEAGMAQIGASDPTKRIITGLVIIAAVMLDKYRDLRKQGRQAG
ncbi:ABC transporter permease [Paludibacterium purpuratum]|uniref:Monosaccharide ABC transporter membrane protein (CUT2 family) n=1 Tax=Paludibacterium purpuratum TaxID=1144873 RepID=A0A4R7AXY0_9NEIS|nr:ABC transporter permease [Paludibacterium purpuratum]TDR71437.1 monosaccharide ABC transporter membrane protein (CUT2 family) [Paludibacterium purpuratum]